MSDFISNSSCQQYLAHLLLNKFLLGFTTQIKIALNQCLTFFVHATFEKSDKSQKYVTTHTKMCISRPQVKNSCRKPTYMLPFYFLVLITHQNNTDSMVKLKWAAIVLWTTWIEFWWLLFISLNTLATLFFWEIDVSTTTLLPLFHVTVPFNSCTYYLFL